MNVFHFHSVLCQELETFSIVEMLKFECLHVVLQCNSVILLLTNIYILYEEEKDEWILSI